MKVLERFALVIIGLYQKCISPFSAPHCRFYPTCSNYAAQAIRKHGVRRGAAYSIKRLARCHPWNPGGIDEVP